MSAGTLYVSVDPGVVSGLALIEEEQLAAGDTPYTYEVASIEETAEMIEHERECFDLVIICEKFTVSAQTIKTKFHPDSLHFEGWLICTFGREAITFQTPSQAKTFATDDKLRHLDWYKRTKDGHANDAQRHLLTYLVRKRNPYILNQLKGMVE